MKSFHLIYTTTCSACGCHEKHDYRGLGESHSIWLEEAVKRGDYNRCNGCGKTCMAAFSGKAEEEGVKK